MNKKTPKKQQHILYPIREREKKRQQNKKFKRNEKKLYPIREREKNETTKQKQKQKKNKKKKKMVQKINK